MLAEHVLSDSLVLQSISLDSGDVYMLSPQGDYTAVTPNTLQPMVDSFNRLNLSIKAVLEEADNIGEQVEQTWPSCDCHVTVIFLT